MSLRYLLYVFYIVEWENAFMYCYCLMHCFLMLLFRKEMLSYVPCDTFSLVVSWGTIFIRHFTYFDVKNAFIWYVRRCFLILCVKFNILVPILCVYVRAYEGVFMYWVLDFSYAVEWDVFSMKIVCCVCGEMLLLCCMLDKSG